jgi:hypothetical protein
MFEEELKMESDQGSNWIPYLAVAALLAVLLGTVVYFVMFTHQTLTPEQATTAVTAALKGPAVTTFKTGKIAYSQSENVTGANYKLLQKHGYLTTTKSKNGDGTAKLTPAGEKLLASIPGVTKEADKDGSTTYKVPLATRKLVNIDNIAKISPTRFQVTYTWAWVTNPLGDYFDIASDSIQKSGFTAWEKQSLIDKYGATFFHKDQKKVTVPVVKTGKGWQVSEE